MSDWIPNFDGGGQQFVVWWHEHLRDGHECGAKVVSSVEEGIKLMNKIKRGYAGCNVECRLFLLGPEVPTRPTRVEVPREPEVTDGYELVDRPVRRKRTRGT